jgi:hypothetical protein
MGSGELGSDSPSASPASTLATSSLISSQQHMMPVREPMMGIYVDRVD